MTMPEAGEWQSDEWVSATEAVELLLPMYGQGHSAMFEARKALAKRAHGGLLRARARRLRWQERDRTYSSRKNLLEKDCADVPASFWWAKGEAGLEQDWMTGDFSTWIDREYHWEAFGVEFARRDVEAMRPKRTAMAAEPLYVETDKGTVDTYGGLPPDDQIKDKMLELIDLGASRDVAAMIIRQIKGFEKVGNDHARRCVKGHVPRGRRKGAQTAA